MSGRGKKTGSEGGAGIDPKSYAIMSNMTFVFNDTE